MTEDITAMIAGLPEAAGVYFFYTAEDNLVYVGKSINIRQRVKQHFSGKDRKSLKIQLSVKRIAFEITGSELIALLYESELIKRHQPLYNRSQRRTVFQYGLYLKEINGYKALVADRIQIGKEEITTFSTLREAKSALYRITDTYKLCQKINGLYKSATYCFGYQIKQCNGACMEQETPEDYNARVDQFLNRTVFAEFTQLFEVAGRTANEKGLVYIEKGVYKGFGYCPIETKGKKRLSYIKSYQDNRDVRRILIRHLINN